MRSRTSRLSRLALMASVAVALVLGLAGPGQWSAAQETDGLAGDYAVSIGSNDIPKDLASGSILVGRWHVAFQADGSYYAERLDIGRVVSGSWEVDGETLTVTDEEGLVSCSNATAAIGDQGDVSTGVYSFERDAELLVLTQAEDGCRTRSVLFGTRDFAQFVACLTNAQPDVASPVAEATPVTEDELGDGRGETNDGGLLELLTPTSGQADDSDDEAQGDDEETAQDEGEGADGPTEVDSDIDDLLAQMTSCWQTQDADQFLPLLTDAFRAVFLVGETEDEQRSELEELMIQPLTWERAGDLDLNRDEDEATSLVRLSIAGADQFLTYRFVFEGDQWLWDGQEA